MKTEYDLKKLKKRPGHTKVDKSAAKIPISIRLDGSIVGYLKSEAERLGLPYQTFIGSILYRYAHGQLFEKQTSSPLKKTHG